MSVLPWFYKTSDAQPFEAEYLAYLDALPDALTQEQQNAQNSFVVALKTAGLWDRMKTGYFFAFGSKGNAKINLKDPLTYTITEVNTVPFDEGRGIGSDRYSSYFNQPFKSDEYVGIQTDLTVVQYIVDDNTTVDEKFTHGMRVRSATSEAIALFPKFDANGYHYHGTASNAFTNANSKGLYVQTYDGTNAVIYKDGTKTSAAASPVVPNISINRFIASQNNATVNGASTPANYTGRNISADFLFDRFTDADELAFRNAFTTHILPLLNQQRVENAAHGWFIREKAVYHAGSNKTFFSQCHGPSNANYTQYIFQLDHATGIVTKFALGSVLEKDDHNEPSILIRASDSRLIAAYTEHSGTTLRWRISTNPLDISSWGAEQTFDPNTANVFTYLTTYQVTNGDIYIFFRDAGVSGGSTSRWSYVKSTNNGSSFSGYTTYSDFTYSTAAQDPTNANKIHFIVSEHPGDGDFPNVIGTFYFDASDATIRKTDGTDITANIPVGAAHVTVLQTNNSPVQCWIEDVIVDATGKPRALFNLIPDETTTALLKDEYYTEWTGSAWTTPHLLHRASTHYMETDIPSVLDIDSKWYAPLGAFDRSNPDRIFSSKEVSGVCEIHKLTRISASSFTSEQLTFGNGYDQWRPFTTSAPTYNVWWTSKRLYDHWLNTFCEDLRYATFEQD